MEGCFKTSFSPKNGRAGARRTRATGVFSSPLHGVATRLASTRRFDALRQFLSMHALDDRPQPFDKAFGRELLRMRTQTLRIEARRIEASQHARERFGIRLVEECAGLAVDDRLERTAGTIGDGRASGRGRFERDEAEVFLARNDCRARVPGQLVEPGVGYVSEQSRRRSLREFAQGAFRRTGTGDEQRYVSECGGADRKLDSFVR